MCVCTYEFMYVLSIHVCIYVCMYVSMHVCIYEFMYISMYVRVYACMYGRINACTSMYLYMDVGMYAIFCSSNCKETPHRTSTLDIKSAENHV